MSHHIHDRSTGTDIAAHTYGPVSTPSGVTLTVSGTTPIGDLTVEKAAMANEHLTLPLDRYAAHFLTGERHVEQDFSERGMLKRLFDPTPAPRWPLWLPLAILAALAAYAVWSLT